MSLRYDPKLNRYQNVRYNTPGGVDYEALRLKDPVDVLNIDEYYQLCQTVEKKTRLQTFGLSVGVLSQFVLGRLPLFVGLHGYSRAAIRILVLTAPFLIPAIKFGNEANRLYEDCINKRLNEHYQQPISKNFII